MATEDDVEPFKGFLDFQKTKKQINGDVINEYKDYKLLMKTKVYLLPLIFVNGPRKKPGHVTTSAENHCNNFNEESMSQRPYSPGNAAKFQPDVTFENKTNERVADIIVGVCYKCIICSKIFARERGLTLHQRTHDDSQSGYKCHICSKVLTSKAILSRHRKIHNENRRVYNCEVCGNMFYYRKSLLRHMSILHAEHKTFTCYFCKQTFTEKRSLENHLLIHAGAKAFSCEQCGSVFRQSSTLALHRLTAHENSNPFTCKVCRKNFLSVGSLKRHERIFHSGKPSTMGVLVKHQKFHETNKRFSCNRCNKTFQSGIQLVSHKKVHMKPNSKNNSEPFNSKMNFSNHSLTDPGFKLFGCNVCNKTFISENHLRIHQNGHGKIKSNMYNKKPFSQMVNPKMYKQKFPCHKCMKMFVRKHRRDIHMKYIDCSLKPFICVICNLSFVSKGKLVEHKIKHEEKKILSQH